MNGDLPDDPGLDLAADRVLGGSRGGPGHLDDPDYLALALAAAAADLALGEDRDAALPELVRARVAARLVGSSPPRPPRSTARRLAWGGWIAAAASLLFAAFAWRGERASTPPGPERDLAAMRAVIRPLPMTATDHPLASGGSGEMVWSESDRRGYLTVRGLAAVDPAKGTYQLWIFDAERDPRYPVDGGVFTVSDPGRPTTVPIRPTLAVSKPSLFAVTLEPPGGVVVSDRKRIMLTGSP